MVYHTYRLYKTLQIVFEKHERNKDSYFQIRHMLNVYYQPGTVLSAKGCKDTWDKLPIVKENCLIRKGDINLYNWSTHPYNWPFPKKLNFTLGKLGEISSTDKKYAISKSYIGNIEKHKDTVILNRKVAWYNG